MSDLPGGTPHLGALVAQVSGHPGSKERDFWGRGRAGTGAPNQGAAKSTSPGQENSPGGGPTGPPVNNNNNNNNNSSS